MSGNGRIVSWESQSRNLTAGFVEQNDQIFAFDIFRRDMVTKVTTLVSGQLGSATKSSNYGAISRWSAMTAAILRSTALRQI